MISMNLVKNVLACSPHSTTCAVQSPFGSSVSLSSIFSNLFNVFYFIVGLVFFILIIVSGIRIIVSSGDREKVAKAKKTMTAAVIGLAIILLAGVIAQLIAGLLGVSI